MLRHRLEAVILRVAPNIRFEEDIQQQLDSLQIVALLDEIEKEFKVSLPTFQLFSFSQRMSLDALEKAIVYQQSRTAEDS